MSDRERDSPYRTPTRAVDVELGLAGGRIEEVTLYLATVSETHAGPETMEEALNRDRDFLPVRAKQNEQTFLVRRSAIRTVTIGHDEPEVLPHEDTVAAVDLVRLELDDGEIVEGTLATVLPPERPRLSDYFNDCGSAFVPLAVERGVTYVNRNLVSFVWW